MKIHFKDGKPFGYLEDEPKVIEDCHGSGILYDCAMEDWQSSCIAIKEPEFKENDKVYWKGRKWANIILMYNPLPMKHYSHYYEGQVIDENEIEYENIR